MFRVLATSTLAMATFLSANNPASAEQPGLALGISAAMNGFVDKQEIAGAVALVASGDKILHLDAVGKADIAGDKPMKIDTICWIASMTKPVTGTAVMMMHEEGKLSVEDPVSKYLPEFKDLKNNKGEPVVVTIRQLLTHTSGMSDLSPEQSKACKTLADTIAPTVKLPVQFKPGTQWRYCQSSINTAARVVEVVSGQAFPEFLEERLFKPLGMKDTTFYLREEQLPRLAKSYARTNDGKLQEAAVFILHGLPPTSRERYPTANGGLFSTAPDYVRFCQMVLRGGELDGKRYLKPESVKYMTSVLTDNLKPGFTPGNGWGLAWCVIREPQGPTAALSSGSHGHGGAYGTQAWIDPKNEKIYVLMVQRANFPNSDASELRQALQKLGSELKN